MKHILCLAFSLLLIACQDRNPPPRPTSTPVAADNSQRNQELTDEGVPNPQDQSNDPAHVETTTAIRQELTASETLSVNAKNVKIITLASGVVHLVGPVDSDAEKSQILSIARKHATRVQDHLTVNRPTSSVN